MRRFLFPNIVCYVVALAKLKESVESEKHKKSKANMKRREIAEKNEKSA